MLPPADASAATSARWKGTFVGMLVLVATIFCSAVLHHRAMAALKHEVQDKLLRTALGIAGEIDGDLHRTFRDRTQEDSPDYARALEPLQRALHWRDREGQRRNDYSFIYTCVLVDDQVFFILDPTESAIDPATGLDEKSHIMQPYPGASEKMIATLRTGLAHADELPYTDQWGTFVSGYAPFFDSAGRQAGAVGVDWYADTYAERLAGIRRAWYLQIVLCLASGFLSGLGTGIAMVRRERAEAARRHAIEEAERTRRRWRIMVETLPKPAAHLEDGELWINDELVRLLGHPREAVPTAEAWFAAVYGGEAEVVRRDYEEDRAAGFSQSREVRAHHADGSERWLQFTAHVYAPGEVWIVEDITERRSYQSRLIAAREAAEAAMQAKGAFLATVSHEIRTPMNGVIGMTHLLRESPLDVRQQEMVETIRASGETLVVLINDILDYSKIESGGMQLESAPFALREAVEDCVQLFAGPAVEKGLHLVVDVAPDCPAAVLGDSNRFRQILSNLIGNAVKFTTKGEVVVGVTVAGRVEPGPARQDGGEAANPRSAICIDVRDTGIGIPADKRDRLFQRFSQVDSSLARRHGGTGLGLAIARSLAELMGGTLELAESSAEGSVFRFCFEAEVLADLEPEESGVAPKNLRGLSVLVVQPHEATARVIRVALERWEAVCTVVDDAPQALRHLRHEGPYAVMIADLQLPQVDGLALCRQAEDLPLELRPRTLLLSPLFRDEIETDARAAGVQGLLLKPIRPSRLRAAVEGVVGDGGSLPETTKAATVPVLDLRILVAEDNLVNQLVIRRLLERLGGDPVIVNDGDEALRAVQASDFDVVFMDVQMPGLSGYEASRRIREVTDERPRPWIIALTANALADDRATARRHGMDDYLVKPIRPADLEAALRAMPRGGESAA